MLTEDEVDCSFDVALSVDLVASLSKKSVLVSVKTDTIVSLFSVVRGQSDGLRTLSIGVLDVDVVELGVCGLVDHGARGFVIGSTAEQRRAVLDGDNIAGVRSGVCGVSIDGESCGSRRDSDLLGVGTSKDEDALSGGGGCAQRINGLLNLLQSIIVVNSKSRWNSQLSTFRQIQQL